MTAVPGAPTLASQFDVLLFDLDGVCFQGANPVPHAAGALAALRSAQRSVRFVTNNASRTHAQVSEHLLQTGIEAAYGEIVTSSDAIAAVMAAELEPESRVLVIGTEGLSEAVRAAGLTPVASADAAPAAVVQGYGPAVGWPQLAEGTYAINAGARYYASNLDLTLPTERGFAPGNGALVAAITTATGVRPVAAGKPAPGIFRAAVASAAASSALMVGDRLDTDIRGANGAGYASALVLTGVNGPADAALAPASDRPGYILQDLRGLGEPYLAPVREPGGWRLGGAFATWHGEQLTVTGGTVAERARCLCAAAWERADAGMSVTGANLAGWDQT